MNEATYRRPRKRFSIEHLLLSISLGGVLFFVTLLTLYFGFQFYNLGRIYPGISVGGVDVSGLQIPEATDKIEDQYRYHRDGRIVLSDLEKNWVLSPGDLGVMVDLESSASRAFKIGRQGGPIQLINDIVTAWFSGQDLPVAFIYNETVAAQFLSNLANELNQPVREPSIRLEGTDVVVEEGQTGRVLNIPASLDLITKQIQTGQDGIVTLVMLESKPTILDIESQAKLVEAILSKPLTFSLPAKETSQPGPWTISPADLSGMLEFELQNSSGKNQYQVTINNSLLRDYLEKISPEVFIQSENPRFMFNDDTSLLEVIKPAVIGQQLDIETSLEKITTALLDENNHTVELVLNTIDPQVTDEVSGEELGITELFHAESTYFYGSSTERIQNITKAASEFHGLLVAPYETFSMAAHLSNISLDNGYAEALIIYGDQTIQGVGGGVCQVSTTLFRTVFFAGFPIIERHPHSYRVSYYERVAGGAQDDDLAGMDATVYVPLVDFKFRNDTPNWLLMETYVNPGYNSILWKFYSTSDGRTVDWTTTGPSNIIPAPETKYRENPELDAGETRRVDYKADGAEITVNRTVYLNGGVHLADTIYTKYEPWAEVIEYGPGTEGYPPENNNDEDED